MRSKKLVGKRWHRVTAQEYYALLDAAPLLSEKVAYALLYTSGTRPAEAFNLTWDCVDFENARLIIANREATANLSPFEIKDHESRRIPLPPETIDLLTRWHSQAPEGVLCILLTSERYELVKAKWKELRKK